MCHGIAIVGANGSGKTTLGKYLADLLEYRHMDAEDYFFKDSVIPYTDSRTREEVQTMLLADIKRCGSFVISSVNGDYGASINSLYEYVVYLDAPLKVRLERVKKRSFNQFGSRVLPGGDLYEREQEFYKFVALRTMEKTDAWLKNVKCPVIHVDGTKEVAENVDKIFKRIKFLGEKYGNELFY